MAARSPATDAFLDRRPRAVLPKEAIVPLTLRVPTPDEASRGIVIAAFHAYMLDRPPEPSPKRANGQSAAD